MQVNDDGTTFTRPVLGYWVWRAEVKAGVQGSWKQLNPDALVVGMLNEDGTTADGWYEDTEAAQGSTYVYAVSAVDMGGESAKSSVSSARTIPVNPNTPPSLTVN